MAENRHGSRVDSRLPSRVTAAVAFFVGFGAVHLLAAGLNLGSSTPFYTQWFAIYGSLFVVSGGLLYRRHRLGVPAGFVAIGISFLSNIYEWTTYPFTLTVSTALWIVFKLGVVYVLVTIARDH